MRPERPSGRRDGVPHSLAGPAAGQGEGEAGSVAAADLALLEAFHAGEVAAFEQLLARYRSPIVHFLFRMTGDLGLAEDLGQEVFVRVHGHAAEKLGSSAQRGSVRSWIYAIARNLAIDHARVKFRIFGRRGRSVGDKPLASLAAGESPEQLASRNELRLAVAREISRLPEPYRSAVSLLDIAMLPYAEAAQAMGCNPKTLSSRVARARRMLRERIDPMLLESLE